MVGAKRDSKWDRRRNKDWLSRTFIDYSFDALKDQTITVRKLTTCEHRFIVKAIKKSTSESLEGFRTCVYNEIEVQRLLRSEYVPVLFNFHDDSVSGGKIYVAMEMANISLDRLLFFKEQKVVNRIPLFVVQRWARCTLSGLDYLDQLGVVHRDLKPSNLLVVSRSMHALDLRNARILISDFGSSYLHGTTYPAGNTNITLQYSAPEILCAEGVATIKSDLFSMMIILIKCATFQHVFMGNRIHDHASLASLSELRALFSQEPQVVVGETSLYSSIMAPLRLFSPVPIIHFEDDQLRLARDFRALIMTVLKPDPKQRPTPRAALNYAFLKARDLQGSEVIYRSLSIRLHGVLTETDRRNIYWSAAAKTIDDAIGY